MHTISLDGLWTLSYGPQHRDGLDSPADLAQAGWPTIPASVPGNVELDLMAAGKLDDPSTGDRIYALRKLEAYQWWYRRSFRPPPLAPGQRCYLVFEGLDCLGTAWLNGAPIGAANNMLIPHRFDVTGLLRPGHDNELVVRINSAVLEGRRRHHAAIEGAAACGWESLSIRKAPHMYGWDIMPRAVSAGLWRDVSLQIVESTHLRDVHWTTLQVDPERRSTTVSVAWEFTTDRLGLDRLQVRVTLRRPGGVVYQADYPVFGAHGRQQFTLTDVALWWPRGYGEPALYDGEVRLVDADGAVLDARHTRVGWRTVELRRTPITAAEVPGEFLFLVNGEKIFVKGTNWVPLDAFHSRDTQHLEGALEMLADLNCQMVRCWGGNVYEDHAFYDFCDEQGIMVWQDFAFACALYPQDDAFLERVRREAQAIIVRLRNHPSLVLWAGNNESDDMYPAHGLGHVDPNSDRISRRVLAEAVRQYDPFRPYLPSSPYHSPELVARGNRVAEMPEVHLWGPRGYYKDPFYTATAAHFVSEIGYHGCPQRESLEQMLDPEFLWPWQDSKQWRTKSVRILPRETASDYRIGLLARQITYLFGETPDGLDDFVLASQITQAEALKFFIEWWRQGKWRRTGILWWNLRDGWPIISDAIVDYYGRKKLAYHFVKRVQVDVCAIVGEAENGCHPVSVVNDTLTPVAGRVVVRDADTGRVLLESDFSVEANGKAVAGRIAAVDSPAMWLIDWRLHQGGEHHSHYLAGSPPVSLETYRRWLGALGVPLP
jgi:beta-mannosidase